jgi:signal transduction histidine kinase
MGKDRIRFALSADRRVPSAVVVLLTLPAIGQALGHAFALANDHPGVAPATHGAVRPALGLGLFLTALPLCLLAAATTVPLLLRPPLWAAVSVSLATIVALTGFRLATVTGVVAVILAVYRLGATPGPASASAAQRMGPYLAVGLALPFLLMAMASRGMAEVILAAGVPAAAGTGIAIRARQSATGEDEARSVLSDALTEHMARGERARIARELHDVVAHHISMVAVQAETARLTTPGLPDAGAARLREIGDTARAGLTEMRRLLGVLREDVAADEVAARQPQPGLPQVAALVDVARDAAASGVGSGAVRLIVSGPVTSYEPGTELVAYRIVQEALTNARRHAPGAAVDVELIYAEDVLRVRVRDNGPGPPAALAGPAGDPVPGPATAGHGLLGMRERAATVGGLVQTGAAPGGGFLVEAVLPAKPDELMTSGEIALSGRHDR